MKKDFENKINNIDWDFIGHDTKYLTHNIHRYSGKYIPQIARCAINLISKKGDVILDPYCGSGTTLLESTLAGRFAIGIDLNPLATLISVVKTTPIPEKNINDFYRRIEEKILELSHQIICDKSAQMSLFKNNNISSYEKICNLKEDIKWNDDFFKKWFKEERRAELIYLEKIIKEELCSELKNIGLLALSDILRKISNANTSYPNVMFDKNKKLPPSAAPIFLKRLKYICKSVMELEEQLKNGVLPITIYGDATKIPIKNNSIDAIITHPPYIGSIPYAEYGILNLKLLGYNPKDIDKKLTGGKRQSKMVYRNFVSGYQQAISECFRVLKPKKYFFIMVGNPTIRGKVVDLKELTLELAIPIGFKEEIVFYRNGINKRANLMGKESLIFLRK
jgi:DNA modification methylase